MKKRTILALALCLAVMSGAQQLLAQTKSPESLGISSQAILDFIDAAEKERKDELHSFILLRHGQVAAQGWWNPYEKDSPHMLFSLSKSFTSTAVGMAQAEGLLNINDRVISFFPDKSPAQPSANLQAMRIRDLLSMNTGHNDDATARMVKDTASWTRGFLSLPVEHKPGTHFVYNSAATYMLSAIIQKVTGKTLLEYLTPRLFVPLSIEHPSWEKSPEGICTGGWGLMIRTQDIASFGQLYLQKGIWQGKQLIPAAWVEEATKKQTSNGSNPESDWEQGYGYQFWITRYGLYRGDGAFGQFCIVFPKQDAVLAITSGTTSMGAIMNLVWKHLLPALKDQPLEENAGAFTALRTKLGQLQLSSLSGSAKPADRSLAAKQTYTIQPNEDEITQLTFDLKSAVPSVAMDINGKTAVIPFGNGVLKNGRHPWPPGETTPVSASGGWITADTLQIRMYLSETPYVLTYSISFKGDEIHVIRTSNVNVNGVTRREFTGRRKKT